MNIFFTKVYYRLKRIFPEILHIPVIQELYELLQVLRNDLNELNYSNYIEIITFVEKDDVEISDNYLNNWINQMVVYFDEIKGIQHKLIFQLKKIDIKRKIGEKLPLYI